MEENNINTNESSQNTEHHHHHHHHHHRHHHHHHHSSSSGSISEIKSVRIDIDEDNSEDQRSDRQKFLDTIRDSRLLIVSLCIVIFVVLALMFVLSKFTPGGGY